MKQAERGLGKEKTVEELVRFLLMLHISPIAINISSCNSYMYVNHMSIRKLDLSNYDVLHAQSIGLNNLHVHSTWEPVHRLPKKRAGSMDLV